MRVAVLGAASFSTPHLVRHLARRDDVVPMTVVLAGRTLPRVAAVARASRILAEGSLVDIEVAGALEREWRGCLHGAGVVLVQVRVGGYDARSYDETFPLEFDLCGDEGLGPGGLAAAWRTWPVLRGILQDVRATCPSAAVVILTSPVSLLVRIARNEFPELDIAGICELPFTTLCAIAREEGARWNDLEWEYIGINHIGWLYGIASGGARSRPLAPLKYLRLEESRSEVLAEQRARPGGRAADLTALARVVLDTYERGSPDEIEHALSARTADWYEAAVGPWIASRAGAVVREPLFLSVPQRGWSAHFEPDDVLEIPHFSTDKLARRLPRAFPPPEITQRLQAFVRYERVAARAVAFHDKIGIEQALSIHPWVPPSVPLQALGSRVCASDFGAEIASRPLVYRGSSGGS